jgi:hypothetical protein
LAERFEVSVGTIKNWLKILRDKNLPILYCRDRQTYYYAQDVEVRFFWINNEEDLKKIQGGENIFVNFNPSQNFCLGASDLWVKLINNEEQNDASGFGFSGFGY